MEIAGIKDDEYVELSQTAKLGLRIWDEILAINKGASYDFVLNRLPTARADIYVDAADSWGLGGYCGRYYFLIPWHKLQYVTEEIIARKELLACLISIFCFGDCIARKMLRIWTDNDCAYHWLRKGRSCNEEGNKYLTL